MIKKLMLYSLLILQVSPSFGWQSHGAGLSTCETWLRERNGGYWYDMTSWVLGYHAAAQDQAALELNQVEVDAVERFVDQYCAANPEDNLLDASRALIVSLKL